MMDPLKHHLISTRRKDLEKNLDQINNAGFDPKKFCLMPFVNIILEPNGSVGLCRHKGTEHSLGNLNNSTWKEIWNGPKAMAWREEFLVGKPQECLKELRDQSCNLCPELGKMFPENPEAFLKKEIERPLRLTANFNGQCNLQCQMCDVWQLPNGFYTEENFWKDARESLFPHLQEIDMLSGEPFIQADTYKLINEVSSVNPNCLWSITTNAHWRLNSKVKTHLDKIKIKNLILSIDSLDEKVYAKIRYPGKLQTVLNTVEDLREYEQVRVSEGKTALNFNLNFVVQKDNWREIPSVIDYCLKRNLHPFITFCYIPSEHSLLNYKESQRVECLNSMVGTFNWGEICLSHRVITPLMQSLQHVDKAQLLAKMKEVKLEYEALNVL